MKGTEMMRQMTRKRLLMGHEFGWTAWLVVWRRD